MESIHQEYKEHEDLPNTTNPDDWAKISGKKGERIVYMRTIVQRDDEDSPRAAAPSSAWPPVSTSSGFGPPPPVPGAIPEPERGPGRPRADDVADVGLG